MKLHQIFFFSNFNFLKTILMILSVCGLSSLALAGTVAKTKGKKVYIVFDKSEGGTFQKDDLFNITDANGKKIGIVELKKVKGLKALGVLKKGKALQGNNTLFRSIGKKTKMKKLNDSVDKSAAETEDESSSDSGRSRWGLQLGYGMASQDVVQDTGTAAQTGSSMAVKGILDYPIFSSLSLHGALGAEIFSVSGTGQNAQTLATDVEISSEITFVTLDTLLKYSAYKSGSTKLYLLGGIGIFQPMSKSSDSIDPETITNLVIGEFGAGIELPLAGWIVPIDVTYYYFPKSETVETSVISIKFGVYF